MANEGRPIHLACRFLEVAASGFCEWRSRPPSARAVRHAWLSDVIGQIHTASNGSYGAPRVHAELTLGYGVTVGHNTVGLLMRRAGLQGLPQRRRRGSRLVQIATATDLVDRNFARPEPNLRHLAHRYCSSTRSTTSRTRLAPRGPSARVDSVGSS